MAKRKNVLMALSSTHHGFFRGISQYACQHGWHLNSFMAYSGKIPLGWSGDGIISYCGYRDELADFIRASSIPKVELSLGRDDLDVPKVAGDNRRIGQLAAEHYLGRHFTHFAWAPYADDLPNRLRLAGFQDTLKQHNYNVTVLPTAMAARDPSATIDWLGSRKKLIQALKKMPKPFAVFAYNDGAGVEVIDACLEADLLVPEQVAVLGVDNDQTVCESVPVQLSSVQYDLDELAYQAAALLDRLMAGQRPPEQMPLVQPRGIFTRHSTDILAMDNVEVAKALRFIWSHYADPALSAEYVAGQTSLTSRGLRKAFQKTLHRSIHQEIMRVRMEKVTELLKNTNDTVETIAAKTGFASANNLFRAFRRIHGTSPGDFRKLHKLK